MSMDTSPLAKLRPGSWIRIPIQYQEQCRSEAANAYHHAIIICPLLEIGFNAAGTIIDRLHVTSNGDLYDCSMYEIIDQPQDYEQCEEIIGRALKYYGARKYSQMFNNCEHFASYCFTGKSESKQVKQSMWSTSSQFYRFIQNSSIVANAALFLNGYNLVSDEVVNRICITDHQIGKINGKLADLCDDKVESNKIENHFDIKSVAEINERKMNDDDQKYIHERKMKADKEQNDLVQEAKWIRSLIRDSLNGKGRIEKDRIDSIIVDLKFVVSSYYEGQNTVRAQLLDIFVKNWNHGNEEKGLGACIFLCKRTLEYLC